MRIVLNYLDQLLTTTVAQLPNFCAAVVAQFEELAEAANHWAAVDHNPDGTHAAVRFDAEATAPSATAGAITVYWDGTNLKYVKPDGSTGNIV